MPQNLIETFARGLLDQIVFDAFDEVKTQVTEEVSEPHTQHNNIYMEYNERDEKEVTERMIHDLQDIQIGDSSYVLSPSLLHTERQVRRTACFVDNASIDDSDDVVEMSGIQGQGDVESIAYDAESAESKRTEPTTTSHRREKEQSGTSETTKVSINLLHRMIEELETVTEETTTNPGDIRKPDERSKEEIAMWEETEEKLIRIIEGTEESPENIIEESRSIKQFAEEDREELKSSMLMSGASSSRNLSFDEVFIEETTSDCPPQRTFTDDIEVSQIFSEGTTSEMETEAKSKKNKKGKKESLGRRLKRFFLRSLKREKH
ncbi:hypothetical protein KPH14_006374 [Odynerus spinipes]|uniref:Uncharacterized protein n=1 Tax=Odynerus spinipes TaxID=1348599 RepID=A0AAD9VWR5_9HYME|nr:hypothetical protein KPH14_006374 [Odynerus spinipes]